MIRLRPATAADVTDLIALLDAARARYAAAGYDMWPLGFTPEALEPALSAGRTFLATAGDAVVGTVTVDADDPLWADRADLGLAGYVHRVAVRERGTGLGSLLLAHAEHVVAGRGGDRLRLDCIAWDPPLRRYYERAGFSYLDDVPIPPLPGVPPPVGGPFALSRFERPIRARR